MRMGIQAFKEQLCLNLDAMVSQINRLLPPEDPNRYQKRKGLSKEQWKKITKDWGN